MNAYEKRYLSSRIWQVVRVKDTARRESDDKPIYARSLIDQGPVPCSVSVYQKSVFVRLFQMCENTNLLTDLLHITWTSGIPCLNYNISFYFLKIYLLPPRTAQHSTFHFADCFVESTPRCQKHIYKISSALFPFIKRNNI